MEDIIVNFVENREIMNLETRKINLINWLSTVQEEDVLNQVEKIQKEKSDWWNSVSDNDKKAINEGVAQLDKGDYLTRSEVRSKIKENLIFNYALSCKVLNKVLRLV